MRPRSSARTTSATATNICRRCTASMSSDFPHFRERFGPRGVMDCKATDTDDATVDPRFGRVGKQTVNDTGPLTKKRMETIDDDIAARSTDYIKRQAAAGQPFFVWI